MWPQDEHQEAVAEHLDRATNKLAKWRNVFAGWQLGTRLKSDPESQAVRDAAEARLLIRAELNAVVMLLLDKGIITAEDFAIACTQQSELLDKSLEQRFPGIKTTNEGLVYDERAGETMKGWLP